MPQTAFCYHCAVHHLIDQMRQIETKGGRKWRCIKSIDAVKKDRARREAFGRQATAINRAESQAALRRAVNPERNKG